MVHTNIEIEGVNMILRFDEEMGFELTIDWRDSHGEALASIRAIIRHHGGASSSIRQNRSAIG